MWQCVFIIRNYTLCRIHAFWWRIHKKLLILIIFIQINCSFLTWAIFITKYVYLTMPQFCMELIAYLGWWLDIKNTAGVQINFVSEVWSTLLLIGYILRLCNGLCSCISHRFPNKNANSAVFLYVALWPLLSHNSYSIFNS